MVKKSSQRANQGLKKTRRPSKQNGVFQAEAIRDVAYVKGTPFYKVKWFGFPESESTWYKHIHYSIREPVRNLNNFKPQMAAIHKNKNIGNFSSFKELQQIKLRDQLQVKTEETIKRIRKTGRKTGTKAVNQLQSKKQVCIYPNSVNLKKPDIQIEPTLECTNKVLDLQQVYHYQTQKVHILARVVKKIKEREQQHWVHLSDLKKSNKCVKLLTDFLLDNVQFESKVLCVDDKDSNRDEFKQVNFNQ